ncbi:MAG: class I SAM-dependent RNA methyltransferase [Desulfobacteraceae bacterium]|nr:MAG: class I SAM-dependent RNA methyltransferase [Desulfobacteraceae bacterium]
MQRFEYQKTQRFFAQLAEGFEQPAAAELAELGAARIEAGFRGLHFTADRVTLYRVNYQARLISRVLAPLLSFRCRDRDDLYRAANAVDWPAMFAVDQTFAIFANVSAHPTLTHSKFAALCMKDAVADAFRSRFGRRPDVERENPDVWLNLYIEKENATISLDTSGGSLHRRGYRRETVEAPLQETLAAAIIALSGWQGDRPLVDPMCGSGTLLCEALMHMSAIPAGYLRPRFGFQALPDFDAGQWARVKQAADLRIRPLPAGLITGSDIDPIAVRAAHSNCRMLPGGEAIAVQKSALNDLPGLENQVIVCNPPYGLRLNTEGSLEEFYKGLGDFLKRRCKGSEAYIYFGNREMLKHIGLRPAWKKPLRNAGLDGRLAKFELY